MSTAKSKADLSTVGVVPKLPMFFGPCGDDLPDDFESAVIVRLGAVEAEEGGLVIDYRKPDSDEVRRVVFGFADEAMYVKYVGPCNTLTVSLEGM